MAGRPPLTQMSLEEEFLTCGICMELFTRPKILPCVHTFCSDCLRSYLLTGAAVTSRKKTGFPCPTCREHVPIAKPTAPIHTWVDLLKDNFVMSGMLESLSHRRDPAPPPTPTNNRHNDPSAPHAEVSLACTCDVRRVTVCWSCDVLLCAYCSSKHADCKQVEKVEDAGARRRQEMLDWLPPLHQLSAQLHARMTRAQTSLQALVSQRDVLRDDVTKAAAKAMEIVRLQEQQLKLELEASYGPCIQRQQQRAVGVVREKKALTSVMEALQQAVADDDVDLLRQAPSLTKRYNDVMKSLGEMLGEERKEGAEQVPVTFTPTPYCKLRSARLVGILQHSSERQMSADPVTSSPLSPSAPTLSSSAVQVTSSTPASSAVTPSESISSNTDPSDGTSSVSEQLNTTSSDGTSSNVNTATSDMTSSVVTSSCLLTEGPLLRLTPSRSSQTSPSLTTQPLQPTDMTSSGAVSEQSADPFSLSSPELLSARREITCRQRLTFSARVKGDRTQPLIRDLVVTSDGWIVAADSTNRCVKTFFASSHQDNKYQCKRLALDQSPYGVALVEGCCVAVTVPKERQILLLAVRPHLVPLSTLTLPPDLPDSPWAVTALSPQRLALTASPPGQAGTVFIVQIREDGVQVERRYSSLVMTPLYLTAAGDSLVIADPAECHVTCLTASTGRPVFDRHTDGKAMGVASHAHTLLLVDQSPALTLLTNEGRCLHTIALPTGGKAGCSLPRALALASDNTVCVSDESGRIHLLELDWRES